MARFPDCGCFASWRHCVRRFWTLIHKRSVDISRDAFGKRPPMLVLKYLRVTESTDADCHALFTKR